MVIILHKELQIDIDEIPPPLVTFKNLFDNSRIYGVIRKSYAKQGVILCFEIEG